MRRFGILIGAVLVLIIGGAISSYFIGNGTEGLIPVLQTTSVPSGDVTQLDSNKALQLILVIGFILFNLVGASVTGAALFWWLNREAQRAKHYKPAANTTDTAVTPAGEA